jgi:hypothetical protein
MLDHLGTEAVYASLHSADPGDTGANELSGGSPAYARKAITWNAAAAGSMDDSNVPVFDVAAGSTVLYVGLWSALTSGTFYGATLVTQETYGGQGTYTLTDMDLDLNA